MWNERESYVFLDEGRLFVRHSPIRRDCSSLIFLHGLGDSGLAFSEAFDRTELAGFNLISPDLLGFGRSSAALNGDYAFAAQAARVWRVLDVLGVEAVTLVGHSMGSDLATLMASWDCGKRVKSLVSIEGNLTPQDLFISGEAVKAAAAGRFVEWFSMDLAQKILKNGQDWPSWRRYYESLLFCHQDAFLKSAHELVRCNESTMGSRASAMGVLFRSLDIRKIFCWGAKSGLPKETREFLTEMDILQQKMFADASHWLMADQPGEIYSFLREFCEPQSSG